jgi:hypothetical protein
VHEWHIAQAKIIDHFECSARFADRGQKNQTTAASPTTPTTTTAPKFCSRAGAPEVRVYVRALYRVGVYSSTLVLALPGLLRLRSSPPLCSFRCSGAFPGWASSNTSSRCVFAWGARSTHLPPLFFSVRACSRYRSCAVRFGRRGAVLCSLCGRRSAVFRAVLLPCLAPVLPRSLQSCPPSDFSHGQASAPMGF